MIGLQLWSTLLGAAVGAASSIIASVISFRLLVRGQLEQARHERAAIREETALQALRKDLPAVGHRMEWILENSGEGGEVPDPYLPVREVLKEIRAQWLSEGSGNVRDARVRQLVDRVLAARDELEAEGIRESRMPILGGTASSAEFLPRFRELAEALVIAVQELTKAVDDGLMPTSGSG